MRKYIVFWAIVVAAFGLLSAAILVPRAQEAAINEQISAREVFAQELESRYSQIDVVNIRTFVDQNEDLILGLYFDVLSPMSQEESEVVLLDILQGLFAISEGTEDKYLLGFLYGNWQVGRSVCPARFYPDTQSGLEGCIYEDVDPPQYDGRIVVWEGRAP